MTDAEKAMRYDSIITMLNDQLEIDLFTAEAQAKSPTWTKQLLSDLKVRTKLFVEVCDMTDDETLLAKANELQSKVNALR
jgi:hypothetical protein